MNIAIDYRLAAISNRGMARYCREIVKELMTIDTENNYFLIVTEGSINVSEMDIPSNFKFVEIKSSNYIISEQYSIPLFAKRSNIEVFWSPYNTFPVFLSKKIHLLVTIHDLIFYKKSKDSVSLYKEFGRIYRKIIIKWFGKRIDEYFTDSEYSETLIKTMTRVTATGHITPCCLSNDFLDIASKKQDKEKSSFFFTVSGDNPSKNLKFLLDIFLNDLKNETLFIAGLSKNSPLRKYESNNVHFLQQNVSDEELISFYSKCKAFVFPSLEEGFGIPLIEAMCCGAKILSSNSSCLPEILNNQGLLFDPRNKQSFLQQLRNIEETSFEYDIEKYKTWKYPAGIVYDVIKKWSV